MQKSGITEKMTDKICTKINLSIVVLDTATDKFQV